MNCPPEALDEAEKAITAGYGFEEVIVIMAPDGFAWWDWKRAPVENQELFHANHRPRCWMLIQVYVNKPIYSQAAFAVNYFPTEPLN